MKRKLVVYISASLDGFIAKPNNDLSFLNPMMVEGEDYGYEQFVESVDIIIIGRKTYDWVVDELGYFPHKEKESYVITRKQKSNEGNTNFYNGDLTDLVTKLKSKVGKNIYCDGGAMLLNSLLKLKLVDEMILSVIPVVLGDGVSLFEKAIPEQKLHLIKSQSFSTGLVQNHYRFITE